jgi:vitamin B12 transporter
MNTRVLTSTLSLIAIAAASPPWPTRAPATAPTITVIGSLLDAEGNASVSVIDDIAIRRAQNGAATDLLVRLPGVYATRNGGIGGFTGIRIRGAEAEQTLVTIDGVRVGDPRRRAAASTSQT